VHDGSILVGLVAAGPKKVGRIGMEASDSGIGEHSNDWLDRTLAAFTAHREKDTARAARLWQHAGDLVGTFAATDPRRAAACNNAGYGHLLAGKLDEAISLLQKAAMQWRLAEKWIEDAELPFLGRGSAFHFALASRNADALTRVGRHKYMTLARGAAAVTNAVLRRALRHNQRQGTFDAGTQRDIEALEAAFGVDCAEALPLKTATSNDTARPAQKSRFLMDRWPAIARQTRAELRPLVDAVYLTAGLNQPALESSAMLNTSSPNSL
jgi:hypothetical protein